MELPKNKGALKAVVVGGSIAGLSCAHALVTAGWQVTVIEKSRVAPSGSPTGAGLALDPQSRELLGHWISDPSFLDDATFPLPIDVNRATDSEKKISWMLTRDENFNFRAAHWADLHSILHKALPAGIILWGHQLFSFQISPDKSSVKAKARVIQTNDVVEIVGDLLVAADGCLSSIRQHFLPDFKLRYSGYCAWRGVLDFSGKESSDTIAGIHRVYPELGNCLYFDLARGTHCVLYELKNKRLNWLWYINGPEPELKANSLTTKVSDEMTKKMHVEAEKVWLPELAKVMKETKEPFINVIYDSEPLPQLFWDNVVLVGDAAHPTTPHGLRSTNMSILDAEILGQCLEKWGLENLGLALKEYQMIRLPVISMQVLHARKLGRVKQGLVLDDQKTFDPTMAAPEECLQLQQRSMPYFESAPLLPLPASSMLLLNTTL
ncbi:aurachin C monooxygenase/isomerase isoform X1 [Phoenix dactylifera]|uniref:Aurachin C monooxygenase/isomerase isoform X1 n=1 Tax=Phoenix dactylifera TaxID=42345 RepID=A0A8B7C5F1_PHODC|nr:aurachin C monooxygenase/isomerase isoform X1 [Phoenix dactylifera]